jgi:hypothetical protein
VARAVPAAADQHGARAIVVGYSRTDVPHLPFGGVWSWLLHMARWPVLIVPEDTAPYYRAGRRAGPFWHPRLEIVLPVLSAMRDGFEELHSVLGDAGRECGRRLG